MFETVYDVYSHIKKKHTSTRGFFYDDYFKVASFLSWNKKAIYRLDCSLGYLRVNKTPVSSAKRRPVKHSTILYQFNKASPPLRQ